MKKKPTAPTSKKQDKAKAEVLKIGLDIHKRKYVVVCQYDNEGPKSAQTFEPEAFVGWIIKQAKTVGKIHGTGPSKGGAKGSREGLRGQGRG